MSVFASNVNIPAPPDNVPAPRGRGPWRAALVSLAAMVTVVSGCSSTEAGPRQAAELLGTRICIENNFADGVNVTYTTLDSDASRKDPFYYEGDLERDTQSCAQGYTHNQIADVAGTLVIPGQPVPFGFSGYNPAFDAPSAEFTQLRDGTTYYCWPSGSGFDVGETRLWDNGTVRISITRQKDGQNKEFFMRLEPSQGQRVNDPCLYTGGGGPD